MPFDAAKLAADVEAFSQEVRPHEEIAYAQREFNAQVVPLAKKHGLMGMNIRTEYGGRGADSVSYFKALARIGREGTTVRTFFSGHLSIGAYPIQTWGSDALKRKYLPAAARGEKVLAFGLTEPEAGSNPRQMTTTFENKGDHFVLNGVKYLISNGGIADAVVVFAYDTEAGGGGPAGPAGPVSEASRGSAGPAGPVSEASRGSAGLAGPVSEASRGPAAGRRISAFVVDTAAEGFEAESFSPNAKMGMPTSNTAMFEMHGVKVPAENLIGTLGDGFRVAMGTLVSGRLSVAAGCLGVIEDCLAESIEYAKARHQHGKEIARHQLVQEHIAGIEMDRVASESLLLRAAEVKGLSEANPGDKDLLRQADVLAAQAKFFASNAAWDAADRAVQVWGGKGWSTLYRPARHLTDVRVCRIYEGTDEILKLKIAAAVLGKEWEAFK